MRVSVVINPKAGSVNPTLIEEKVRSALFRCDLAFSRAKSLGELEQFLREELNQKTDYFLICGGDGTVNTCLQFLVKTHKDLAQIPPIAVVSSGTANDLAHEIGISARIDQAVRNILEGSVRKIDIIQVSSGDKTVFMLTNGGLGIPAVTAELANKVRRGLQRVSNCPKTSSLYKTLAKSGYDVLKKIGPGVYSMMVAEAVRTWSPTDWELEIEIPGRKVFSTKAAIVLVSNQPSIGNKFLPAPYTSNTDGTVNLLMVDGGSIPEYLSTFLHLKNGTGSQSERFKSYELSGFKMRSKNPRRLLTFFGDGEILIKEATELSVKCLHRGLPVVVGLPWDK